MKSAICAAAFLFGCSVEEATDPARQATDAALTDAAAADFAPPEAVDALATDTTPADAAAPFLEVGTGARTFQPLEAGQRIPIVQGIQGGYHVWGALRGGGFSDQNVQLLFRLHDGQRILAGADLLESALPLGPDGHFTYAGAFVIFSSLDVEALSGQPLTLEAQIRAADGTRLSSAIEVVPVCCEQ